MPQLSVRQAAEVPPRHNTSSASLRQQTMYEAFVREVGSNVGELSLGPAENLRAVKVRLRRAASRIGAELQIWDADGKVYFKSAAPEPKRRRSIRA